MSELCPFLHLPWDIHLAVFSYLCPEDLGRLQCVCKFLSKTISQSNEPWKHLCSRVWLVKELDDSCMTWHTVWYKMMARYGRYRHCYSQVRAAWNTIENHLVTHNVSMDVPLTEKRNEEEIASVELKLGLSFPEDFRCSLRIHDGLSCFLGVLEFYYFKSILTLHSIKQLVKLYQDATEDSFYCPTANNTQYIQIGTGWPGRNTAAGLLLALPGCQSTPPGHVVRTSTVKWSEQPILNGQELSSGQVIKGCSVGIIGKCGYPLNGGSKPFKDWLTEESQLLQFHPVINQPYGHVSIIRYYCDPNVVATTGNFTIRVGTALDPSLGLMYQSQYSESIPVVPLPAIPLLANGGSYAYWIEIKMHDDAPKDDVCQLVSRHWVIRYSSGGVERVDGDGVIGECPTFTPGHIHRYASCTRFINEDYCTMEGHFTMRNLKQSGTSSIRVPRFQMSKPEIIWK